MAIDAVGASKVQKKQQIPGGPDEAPATVDSVQTRIQGYLNNQILSTDEVKLLGADLKKLKPAEQKQVLEQLAQQLKAAHKSGAAVRIQDATLAEIKKLPGMPEMALFEIDKFRDKTVTRDVRQGLEATATSTETSNSSEHHQNKAKNVLERQKLDRASRGKGMEVFSLEGRSHDAALALLSHLDDRISDKLPDEVKALKESMGPEMKEIAGAVLREMSPEAKAALGTVKDALLSGDGAALKAAVGESFSGVCDATKTVLKLGEGNPEAMQAFLGATKSVVEHLPVKFQGAGTRVVGEMTKLFAKLTPKAAQVATVGADAAKVATVGAEVAQVGAGAAKVGTAAASAGAKSIPGVNIAVGAVATGFSAMEFIGECRRQPKSWGRFFTSGLNTLLQGVGIIVPGVGAVATLGKFGADAVMGAHEKKTTGAKAESMTPDLASMAPFLKEYGDLGGAFFSAMGYEDAAKTTKAWAHKAGDLSGIDPKDWSRMSPEQRDAVYQQIAAAHAEVDKVKDDPELKGNPKLAGVIVLGEAFKKLLGALRKDKNANTDEARQEVAADAMEAAAKGAAAKEVGART